MTVALQVFLIPKPLRNSRVVKLAAKFGRISRPHLRIMSHGIGQVEARDRKRTLDKGLRAGLRLRAEIANRSRRAAGSHITP